jgi:hypothetical protein
LFASPTISLLIEPPANQEFTELYMLGPKHTFEDIPFNIKAKVNYSVYLGVANHMGASSYHTSFVKITNQTRSLPSAILGTPSQLPALYEFKSFISDEGIWEVPLTFRVNELTFTDGISRLSSITINGIELSINQTSALNSDKTGYYYLFVELWIFNTTAGILQYHNRFVDLELNMTQ